MFLYSSINHRSSITDLASHPYRPNLRQTRHIHQMKFSREIGTYTQTQYRDAEYARMINVALLRTLWYVAKISILHTPAYYVTEVSVNDEEKTVTIKYE